MGKNKELFMEIRESQNLFQIEQEYLQLEHDLYEAEGELTPELEERLRITEESLKTKSKGYINVIKKKELNLKFIKNEKERLVAFEEKEKKVIEKLKNSIENAMNIFNIDEIILDTHKINFRKSKTINIFVNPEDLPKDCQKIEIKAISKNELKKRIVNGEEIPGVELILNKNLQIK